MPDIDAILKGSTILGTGGGGRYDEACRVVAEVNAIELVSVGDLAPDDVVISAYGAGGLTKSAVSPDTVRNAVGELCSRVGNVAAVVPVEIGPYSLAAAFQVASYLGLPVVDGDFVGYRSVPEIFIELITLAGQERCPLVVANEEGDLLVLARTANDDSLEKIVRSFADGSESNTIVAGYPVSVGQLRDSLADGSVSYCRSVSDRWNLNFDVIATGVVVSDDKVERDGFTSGSIRIRSDGDSGDVEVGFKNEYMVARRDGDVLVTCPDFICVVDRDGGLGLNNGDTNTGKSVEVAVRPAIAPWRTPEGLALFSPRRLGIDVDQVLWERELPPLG